MVIRQRGDKFYFILSVRDEYGNPKRIERVGGTTKAAARKAAEQFLARQVDFYGRFTDPAKITLEELCQAFLTECAEVQLKPASARTYRQQIKNHIVPVLGKTQLGKLNYRVLQSFINDKYKQVAPATCELILRTLKRALNYGVTAGQLHGNFWKEVRLPRDVTTPDTDEPQFYVFTNDQLEILAEKFPPGNPIHMPFVISYYTGARLGECLAMRWQDIDEVNNTISINSTLYDDGGKNIIRQASAKTRKSTRTVPLVPELKKELRDYQHDQKMLFLAMGKSWNLSSPICTTSKAEQATSNTVRYFNMYCKKKFGVGCFHDLRHTHATKLLEAKVPIDDVSKHLGHSNVTTTSRIYSHYTSKRQETVADAIKKIL